MSISVQENFSLKPLNTFQVDCNAINYLSIEHEQDIVGLQHHPIFQKHIHEYIILGGGSNILFTKPAYPFILHNQIKGIQILPNTNQNEDGIIIKVGSGERWHSVVEYCIENNWYGLENLAFIPGTIGAAPIQNIGAYGVEIKDFIVAVEAFDLKTFKKVLFEKEDLHFSYRDSAFKHELKNRFFITSVILQLKKQPFFVLNYPGIKEYFQQNQIVNPTLKDVFSGIGIIRAAKLPTQKNLGSAGSFFKNPIISTDEFNQLKTKFPGITGFSQEPGLIKVSAAFLIDQCGLKSYSFEQVACYQNQPLVIVNLGQASGINILKFSQYIQQQVKEICGINLEPEVNIL